MDIKKTKLEYIESPLSNEEIESLQLMQDMWCEYEKSWSISFLAGLIVLQLGLLTIDDSWQTLLIGMFVSLVAYTWFKSVIPKYLDRKFPCRIVIDDETVALPYTKDLTAVQHYPRNLESHPLLQNIAKQKRSLVKFEFELLKHNN